MSKRVFVSSTFVDLREHRAAVCAAIRQLGCTDVAMEHFGARDERPQDECLRLIAEGSDLFVGIYAHRYGHVPQGAGSSITEAEYDAATSARLPRFIYIVEPTAVWNPTLIDKGASAGRLEAFKQKLKAAHICAPFSDQHQLAAKVAADLGRHLAQGDFVAEGHRGILHEPGTDWMSPVLGNQWRYKVAAFDLDGTLLRGDDFQFSWEAVWNGLGFSRSIQAELKREYRRKAQSRPADAQRIVAYREWCKKACRHFIDRRLTKSKLTSLGQSLQLTKNFRQAITRLRQDGFVLAIVSGGIHSFLEEKVPDYRECFDFVFINELLFDAQGRLCDVVATEFDFEGKAKALEYICRRVGCSLEETVFVGDGFNDEAILVAAGLSLAYPPTDRQIEGASNVLIEEDDLTLILPHIRVE